MNKILLVSSNNEKDLLGNHRAVFYGLNSELIFEDNGDLSELNDNNWNFAVIEPGYTEGLEILFESLQKDQIAIANHSNENASNFIIQQGWGYRMKGFSHASHCPLWSEKIEPLLKCIRRGTEENKYPALHQNLWKALVPSPTENAERLRSIVLTPLVGIDLLTQIKDSEDTSSVKAKKIIPDLMNIINAEMDKEAYKKALREMEKVFGTTCRSFLQDIKIMIAAKEVNSHEDFENAARELEQAITELSK